MGRLKEFDYLKSLAAMAVIAIHVTGPYTDRPFSYYFNQIVRFAVPLFIIISGALLYHSSFNKRIKYLDFINRRVKKIYIPYLLWTLIYVFYGTWVSENGFSDLGGFSAKLLRSLVYGTGNAHLYFIIIIMQLYLLFPLLKALCDRWMRKTLLGSLLLTGLFQTAIYLSLLHKFTMPRFFIPYYIFFPTWIFFFVFGMFIAKNITRFVEIIQKNYFITIFLWFISLAILLTDSRYTGTFSSSIKPSIVLYCVATFLLFYLAAGWIQGKWKTIDSIVQWISLQSFIIYFSHLFLIREIKLVLSKLGLSHLLLGSKGMLLLFIAAIIISMIFAFIISLLPVAELFGGVAAKKASPKAMNPTIGA